MLIRSGERESHKSVFVFLWPRNASSTYLAWHRTKRPRFCLASRLTGSGTCGLRLSLGGAVAAQRIISRCQELLIQIKLVWMGRILSLSDKT